MAELVGALQLNGTLGKLSYYKGKNGKTIVRRKGGPSRNEVMTGKRSVRIRENFSEFSALPPIASEIRKHFAEYIPYLSEGSYYNRLVGLLKSIQLLDTYNIRGERSVFNGNVYLLEDFQFNAKASLKETLRTDYDCYLDPSTGNVTVRFDSFNPIAAIHPPGKATHFQILVQAAAVCESEDTGNGKKVASDLIRIGDLETGPISLSLNIDTPPDGVMLVVAGVLFFEETRGVWFALKGSSSAIVGVERIPPQSEPEPVNKKTGKPLTEAQRRKHVTNMRKLAYERILKMVDEGNLSGYVPTVSPLFPNQTAEEKARAEERRSLYKRHLWLQKINKYRYGK
jgi:hypothetical protein